MERPPLWSVMQLHSPPRCSNSRSAGPHPCLSTGQFACSLAIAPKEPTMPSMFNAREADSYERLMGRWSRRLAPLFIEHAGIADGENVIEVGCGTGSLTFALVQAAELASLTAIEHSEIFLAAGAAKS